MKARFIGLGFGILLILAAFGLVLWQGANLPGNIALAQGGATATPSASASATPSSAPQQQQPAIGDTFWTILAGKLNVSPDDLKSKAVDARKEMIDNAVKDGRVTQANADAIKGKITSNNIIAPIPLPRVAQGQVQPRVGPFGSGPRGNFGGRAPTLGFGFGDGVLGPGLQNLEAVAKVLKLDPKALISQLSQGKTLADIAKAQSVDEATVKQTIIDTRKAQIDQLLAYGLISQVQADQLKSQLTPDNIDLTRPLWFQFRASPKSSEVLPAFGQGEAFELAPDEDFFVFGDGFALPPQEFSVPLEDVQTE